MARTPKGVIPHRQAMKEIMVKASEGGLKAFRENPSPKALRPVMAAIQQGLLDLMSEVSADQDEPVSTKAVKTSKAPVTKASKTSKAAVVEEPVKTRKRRETAEVEKPVKGKKHKTRVEEKPVKRTISKSSW